jgi:uncharacterized protein YcbK (DUF882 family)
MGHAFRCIALCLTLSSLALGAPRTAQEHVVQPGQTLAKIAKRYRVELDTLCEANDLKKSAKLQPGLKLLIPGDDERGQLGSTTAAESARNAHAGAAVRKPEPERRASSRAMSYSQYLGRPTKKGWVHVTGHHGEWQGQLLGKSGKLQPKAALALSRLLAWPRTDFAMDRRLLTLLAQVSDAFGGRTLRVVSGYRTTSYASESKHPMGRACDFMVLGVPNAALRDYVRAFDNVGVGYYPNSTFVHLDVRDYDAYWVDYAGPGEPPRYTRYRVARTSDEPTSVPAKSSDARASEHESPDPEAAEDAQPREDEQRAGHSARDNEATSSPQRSNRSGTHRSDSSEGVTAEPQSARHTPKASNADLTTSATAL